MAAEEIGAVSIGIEGDFSPLTTDFDAAVAEAVTKGATLAEAIQMALAVPDSAPVTQAFESVGIASDQAAAQIHTLDGANQQAVHSAHDAAAAMHEEGTAAEHAAHGSHELLLELLEFAGIKLGLEALKEMAIEMINVYSQTERVEIALGRLTGSAEGAAASIEQMREEAMRLALPFDEVLSAAQKMTAFGFAADQVETSIKAAADAAGATGNSFDTATSAIERMALGGMAGARQLVSLGLQSKDLAAVMEVSTDQVQKAFKSLTVEERVQVLTDALKKFEGAGEDLANSTSGQLQRLKTAWELTMDDVGKAMAPAVKESIPALIDAMHHIVAAGVLVVTGIKLVVGAIVGEFEIAAIAAQGLGRIWLDVVQGNFIKGATDARETFDALRAMSKHSWEEMVKDAQVGAETVAKILADPEPAKAAEEVRRKLHVNLAGQDYQARATEIDAEARHQIALLNMKKMGYEEDEKLGRISAQANLVRLEAVNQAELQITEKAIQAKLALQKKASTGDKSDATLLAAQQAAEDKAAATSIKLAQHVEDAKEKIFDQEVKYHIQGLNAELKFEEEVKDHVAKLNDELASDRDKAQQMELAQGIKHQTEMLELRRQQAAWEQKTGRISADQRMKIDQDVDSAEEALQRKAIQRAIDLLDTKVGVDTKYATEKAALEIKLQQLEDTRAKKQQQDAQQRGASNNREIIQLANLQLQTKLLADSTNFLGNTYKSLLHDVDAAFTTLGNNIAAGIMQGKNFWDVWHTTLNSIEQQLLTTVINAILKMAETWLLNLILGRAEAATAGVAEIMTSAAIGAAAAAASTAAIPLVGPFLAPAAAASMYAFIASFAPLATLAGGGIIPEDMLAMVHKDEMVLPKDISGGLRAIISGAGGGNHQGGSGAVVIDLRGAHLSGNLTDGQVRQAFDRGFRMSKLGGALRPGVFPQ